MHIVDAVLVQNSLCNFMKRTLAMVKVWFINMFCFYTSHTFLIGFLAQGCIHHAVARGLIQNFHSYRGHVHAE